MEQVISVFMRILQYLSTVYITLRGHWNAYHYPQLDTIRPHGRYFLSDTRVFDDSYTVVPEGSIYIEQWIAQNGEKLLVVRYEGEEIPREWTVAPYARHAKTPWIWVGDRDTEEDLTRTFNKFLVVGNRILPELITKLFDGKNKKNLIYIQSGTFNELKFPGESLTIEEYDDSRPVQSSG
jgi:hypothetical protein